MMFTYEPFETIEQRIPTHYPGLFSQKQVEAHKIHHRNYGLTMDKLLRGEHGLDKPLPQLMHLVRTHGACASQYWYHTVFWDNLTTRSTRPGPRTQVLLKQSYGSLEGFKSCFLGTIGEHFSNGWYVMGFHRHYEPSLRCMTFPDGVTPMMHNVYPLLVIDLWEHAYYVDYPADRRAYAKKIWEYINWDAVEERLVNRAKNMALMADQWL